MAVALNICGDDGDGLQGNLWRATAWVVNWRSTLLHWRFDGRLAMGGIGAGVLARRFSEVNSYPDKVRGPKTGKKEKT